MEVGRRREEKGLREGRMRGGGEEGRMKMRENSRKREGREGEKVRNREGEGEKKLTWV